MQRRARTQKKRHLKRSEQQLVTMPAAGQNCNWEACSLQESVSICFAQVGNGCILAPHQ